MHGTIQCNLNNPLLNTCYKIMHTNLRENLDNIPPESQDLSFGNSVYRIRFDSRDSRPTFGQRYHFFLQDAVDNVPEYIVRWDNFVEYVFPSNLWLKFAALDI